MVAFVLLAGLFIAAPVRAEDGIRLRVDWSELAGVIGQASAAFGHEGGFRPAEEEPPVSLRAPEEVPWVGSSAHLALIARDWGGARELVGRLSLTDRLRPTRSSRMLVSRIRLADGRVMPFVQVGLGQWRVDTELMPALRRDVELAGQFGGGIEVSIARFATVALEADETILYRQQHESQMVCQPHVWNSLLAARIDF